MAKGPPNFDGRLNMTSLPEGFASDSSPFISPPTSHAAAITWRLCRLIWITPTDWCSWKNLAERGLWKPTSLEFASCLVVMVKWNVNLEVMLCVYSCVIYVCIWGMSSLGYLRGQSFTSRPAQETIGHVLECSNFSRRKQKHSISRRGYISDCTFLTVYLCFWFVKKPSWKLACLWYRKRDATHTRVFSLTMRANSKKLIRNPQGRFRYDWALSPSTESKMILIDCLSLYLFFFFQYLLSMKMRSWMYKIQVELVYITTWERVEWFSRPYSSFDRLTWFPATDVKKRIAIYWFNAKIKEDWQPGSRSLTWWCPGSTNLASSSFPFPPWTPAGSNVEYFCSLHFSPKKHMLIWVSESPPLWIPPSIIQHSSCFAEKPQKAK